MFNAYLRFPDSRSQQLWVRFPRWSGGGGRVWRSRIRPWPGRAEKRPTHMLLWGRTSCTWVAVDTAVQHLLYMHLPGNTHTHTHTHTHTDTDRHTGVALIYISFMWLWLILQSICLNPCRRRQWSAILWSVLRSPVLTPSSLKTSAVPSVTVRNESN